MPFPTPGDLPHSGIEPMFLVSLVLGGEFFTTESPGKPQINDSSMKINVVSAHTGQNGQHKKKKNLQIIHAGDDAEGRECSCTVGGNAVQRTV